MNHSDDASNRQNTAERNIAAVADVITTVLAEPTPELPATTTTTINAGTDMHAKVIYIPLAQRRPRDTITIKNTGIDIPVRIRPLVPPVRDI